MDEVLADFFGASNGEIASHENSGLNVDQFLEQEPQAEEEQPATETPATEDDFWEREDTKKQINRKAREFKASMVRDIKNALSGDKDAVEAVKKDKHAKALYEEMRTYHRNTAREEQTRMTAYNYYRNLATTNPNAYAQEMMKPDVVRFMGQWQQYMIDNGLEDNSPPPTTTSTDDPLDEEYEDAQGDRDYQLLSDDDWEALNPENFTGNLRQRRSAFRKELLKRLTERTTEKSAIVNKAQKVNNEAQNIKAISSRATPSVTGSGNKTDDQIEDEFLNAYFAGNLNNDLDMIGQQIVSRRLSRR